MRTNQNITEPEIKAYGEFAREHNIIADGSQDDKDNSNLIVEYFTKTWPNDINQNNLALAWPQLQPFLKVKSAARIEAENTARQYWDVNALSEWFAKQTTLVNDLSTDDAWLNFAELCKELAVNNRQATDVNIVRAIKSIEFATTTNNHRYTTRQRTPLAYVGKPRVKSVTGKFIESTKVQERKELEAESAQRHADYRPGELFEPSEVEQKRYLAQRAQREAAEQQKNQVWAAKQETSAWERLCKEFLQYGNHSDRENARRIINEGVQQNKEYRFIYKDLMRHKAEVDRIKK